MFFGANMTQDRAPRVKRYNFGDLRSWAVINGVSASHQDILIARWHNLKYSFTSGTK